MGRCIACKAWTFARDNVCRNCRWSMPTTAAEAIAIAKREGKPYVRVSSPVPSEVRITSCDEMSPESRVALEAIGDVVVDLFMPTRSNDETVVETSWGSSDPNQDSGSGFGGGGTSGSWDDTSSGSDPSDAA